MTAEIKEQFQNFMDVRSTGGIDVNRAKQDSSKITVSIYKDVPEIAEERKIHSDENDEIAD